ncbi:MAG: FlgD immunoglobulin-like domain containing protein [Spirochaetaceae bacterium]
MTSHSRILRATILLLALSALAVPVFAGGTQEDGEFVIDIPRQPRIFIAPGVAEAEHQVLRLDPEIAPAPDRVIRSFELNVFNAEGDIVYQQIEEETETRGFFGNLFNIGDVPQIDPELISSLQWDGRDNNGDIVPDGDYIYQLFVVDDEGMTRRTPPQNITVDTTPPVIENLEIPVMVFSPGIESGRESVTIEQDGSAEVSWVARILNDAGEVVRTERFENPIQYDPATPQRQDLANDQRPTTWNWDGRDDDGDIVPDGQYSYELVGRDRPGNEVSETVSGIRVATEEGDVVVAADREAFNPSGRIRTVDFDLSVENPLEIDSWSLEVRDEATETEVYRRFEGTGEPPEAVTWDGRDDTNRIMEDATYHTVFTVTFENGVSLSSLGEPVVIDSVAPSAQVSVNHEVFGGDTKPTLEIDADWQTEASWTGWVQLDDEQFRFDLDEVFGELNVTPDIFPLEWDGRDLDGSELPDGQYVAWLDGEDAAGNRGESNRVVFVLDTRATPIDLTQESDTVSPDFQGVNDEVVYRPELEVTDSVESMVFTVRSSEGDVVRTFTSESVVTEFAWDGRDDAGIAVPEGSYETELQVFYRNGNQPVVTVGPVAVDRDAPRIGITPEYAEFAPNGDGYRDTLPISVAPAQTEGLESWTAIVRSADGDVVRTVAGDGVPPSRIEWDGRTDTGDIVDGRYRVGIRLNYEGGGRVEHFADEEVLLDASGPEIEVSAEPLPFRPEFNGQSENLNVEISAQDEWSDIESWQIDLIDPAGNNAGTIEGSGTPPEGLTWDGTLADGTLVQSAQLYTGRLTVEDELRNVTVEDLDILTDIIVRQENGRLRIVISSIEFEPNSGYLFEQLNDRLQSNLDTLQNLARILNQFPDRDIVVEGHANHIRFATAAERRAEQRDFLLPLSEQRAREVRDALAILGVDLDRMTIQAIGGDRPVVPFDDYDNIWQNRRVEFLLERP